MTAASDQVTEKPGGTKKNDLMQMKRMPADLYGCTG